MNTLTKEKVLELHKKVAEILEGSGLHAVIYDPETEFMETLFKIAEIVMQLKEQHAKRKAQHSTKEGS